MRNLKRALSMAMASVMLMGMSVVGTSAASVSDFSDVDSINNKEAVAIATGLGIFDGYTDGTFKPEKVVTRAEMAVVIAKILHGSDVDPSNFVGANKFTDVPEWAEGYVNLVASLGIIVGVGDGKFAPNQTVTTAEASTMLLKALGYYLNEGDALGADWDLQATSKATALGIYGDKSLKMNEGLTREDVAELTFNALFAQRVAYDNGRLLYVKANDRNIVVTNGTDDAANTLAQNTYGLYAVEGVVVANGMTDEALSASLKSEAQTTVMFTEETDLNQDGVKEYGEEDVYDFEVETGLDMIGHAAKVYYTIEKKAPVVFALVDQAELVAEITYDTNSTKLAKAANEAGFKKNTVLDITEDEYFLNYDLKVDDNDKGTTVKAAELAGTFNRVPVEDVVDPWTGKVIPGRPGSGLDKLILISNDSTKAVDYVIALDQKLDTVADVNTEDEQHMYALDTVTASDLIVANGEFAEDDYVITTDIGNKGEVVVMESPVIAEGNLSKIIGKSNDYSKVTCVVVDGENMFESDVESVVTNNFEKFELIDTIGDVTMVMDEDGRLIGLAETPAAPNYAYVAQFGFRHTTDSLNTDENELTAHIYFADGTNGIYVVDAATPAINAARTLAATNLTAAKNALNGTTTVNGNHTTDLLMADGGLKGLYNVTIDAKGKADISAIAGSVTDADLEADATKLVKGHSTLLNSAKQNVKQTIGSDAYTLLNNNDTVYFYVTGSYNDVDAYGNPENTLSVKVITGHKNVIAMENINGADLTDDDKTINNPVAKSTGIREAFYTTIKGGQRLDKRAEIDTMLIQGVVVENTDVYFYNEGDYEVEKVEGGYTLTYTVYDNKTGDAYTVTYDNNGKYFANAAQAKAEAREHYDGFYTLGANDLVEYKADGLFDLESNVNNGPVIGNKGDIYYVVNDTALYDDYADNLFTTLVNIGSITENVTVIDVCDSGLDTVAKIARAITPDKFGNKGDVKLSYSYDKNYKTAVLFVSAYDPDPTNAPNDGAQDTSIYEVTLDAAGNAKVTLKGNTAKDKNFTATLYVYSVAQAKWAEVESKTLTVTAASHATQDFGSVNFGLYAGERYKVIVEGNESNVVAR